MTNPNTVVAPTSSALNYLANVGITTNLEKAIYSTARIITSRYYVTNKRQIECGRENIRTGHPVGTARKYTNPNGTVEVVQGIDYNDKAYRTARVNELLEMTLEEVLAINIALRALNEIGRESNAAYKSRIAWEAANQLQTA
ncbi:MAG: hypothetical protein RLZZ574_3576 [Cyanobacteriota bacterium]|jgi:hypothetical protein